MTTLSPLRDGRITGSRVAAVLGLSKYQTADDVMRDMVRAHFGDEPEFTGNEATEWGNAHEADAISLYERELGVMVHGGQEIVLHPVHDFLAVTPDGLVSDDGMVEVKCPYRAHYAHIDERPDYEAQIRLQLACTGRAWCDFVVWRPEGIGLSTVNADPAWLGTHLPTLTAFHESYLATIADPELAARHRASLSRDDAPWADAAATYLAIAKLHGEVGDELAEARDVLLALAGDHSAQGCGVSVTRAERKGSVDYAKALKANLPGLDVEAYRKAGSVVFSVRQAS